MSWFAAVFAEVPDPRTGNAKRHDLLEVLTIALTASVCGAESCSDFADFAADREGLFREFLRLETGFPATTPFPGCSGCSTRRRSTGVSGGLSKTSGRPTKALTTASGERLAARSKERRS